MTGWRDRAVRQLYRVGWRVAGTVPPRLVGALIAAGARVASAKTAGTSATCVAT